MAMMCPSEHADRLDVQEIRVHICPLMRMQTQLDSLTWGFVVERAGVDEVNVVKYRNTVNITGLLSTHPSMLLKLQLDAVDSKYVAKTLELSVQCV